MLPLLLILCSSQFISIESKKLAKRIENISAKDLYPSKVMKVEGRKEERGERGERMGLSCSKGPICFYIFFTYTFIHEYKYTTICSYIHVYVSLLCICTYTATDRRMNGQSKL